MTLDEILEITRQRLGFNYSLDAAVFTSNLLSIQSRYEGGDARMVLPWFLLQTDDLPTTASVRTIDLPNDFISFDEQNMLSIVDADGIEHGLTRKMHSQLQPYVADLGMPKYWAMIGTQLWLYPMPDAVYTVKVPSYQRTAVWTLAQDNVWFDEFPNLLIEELVVSLARSTRDEGALKFSQLSQEKMDYITRIEAMHNILMQHQMGSGD